MVHYHTGETLNVGVGEGMGEAAARKVRRFFRDWRQGSEHEIDPVLLELLAHIQERAGNRRLVLLSGYRTPVTNEALPGTARQSYHMRGMAADILIEEAPTAELFEIVATVAGEQEIGFGRYRSQGFAHVDTGPARFWAQADPTPPGRPGVRVAAKARQPKGRVASAAHTPGPKRPPAAARRMGRGDAT